MALFCSLKLVGADGVWGMAPPHSFFPRAGSSHVLFFRKPSQRSRQSPLCVPSFHQIPAFTLPASKLPDCQGAQCSFVFFSGTWLGFRAPNFGDPPNADLRGSSWGGSCRAFAIFWLVPEIGCASMQWFGVHDKAQQKAGAKACCPQLVSFFLC